MTHYLQRNTVVGWLALAIGTASLFVLAARRTPQKYWLPIGLLLGLGFLYAWAELAVGIFFGLGS